jgi:NAD(P)-dependent dehydrogenase (short-subunit alcohol dehydrogenase family)
MNRIAIVTGAASGIGKATAERLTATDWTVVGLDMSFSGEVNDSDSITRLHCDVRDVASVDAAFADIDSQHGYVDAIVCSAGKLAAAPLAEMTPEDFDAIYQVNTRGAWLCACRAIPLMRNSPNRELLPRIVFLGSVAGIRPKVAGGAYGAQKAALHTITGVMAAELGPEGILVNAVAPGTVDTPMIQNMAAQTEAGKYRPSGKSPLGRVASPDDVAAVIEFLLGSQAAYVTGTVIPVDGGTRAAFVPPGA